jgi:rRNA-processing protein FCF1
MHKVILDANFLLVPFQFKVDVFSEIEALIGGFEPIVLSTTMEELKRLSKAKSEKIRRSSSAALELAKKCRIVDVELRPGESYDDAILRVAGEGKYIVATNDSNLRKRLRDKGITTIFLRQKSHLEMDGYA